MTVHDRSMPPAASLSASALEKIDPQILSINTGLRPVENRELVFTLGLCFQGICVLPLGLRTNHDSGNFLLIRAVL
jgi:hypothetical protein